MEEDLKKERFCAGNKCAVLFFILTAVAIVVVVCVTVLSPNVRGQPAPDEEGGSVNLQWWQKAIVYQIYPRSFQDSDGDGTGDLPGIISRLQYLKDLGIGAVWLSPFYKSPMKDFGYDVSDYRDVEPQFGTLQDFDLMIKTSHEQGLKFIVDFVPNHSSDQHVWFQLSKNSTGKYKDYYMWRNASGTTTLSNGTIVPQPPNNWGLLLPLYITCENIEGSDVHFDMIDRALTAKRYLSVFGGSAWEWEPERNQFYFHSFLTSQPDLNYHNPEILKEMDDNLRFWLDKGVDGFRIDAVPFLFEKSNLSYQVQPNDTERHGYKYTKNQPEIFAVVKRWKKVVDEYEKRDGKVRWLLAETFEIPQDQYDDYYQAGSTPFNFDLVTVKALCPNKIDAKCIRGIIKKGVNLKAGQWPNFVTGNHDNGRISDRIGPKFVDAMNMLLLTLPGTPTTYYGEEIGMVNGNYTGLTPQDTFAIQSGDWTNSRDPERNPMQWNTSRNAGFSSGTPWLPVTPNTDFKNVNVEVESQFENSTLGIYKNLARLRQNPAFLNAAITFPSEDDNTLIYIRTHGSVRFLVVIHFGQTPTTVSFQNNQGLGFVEAATKRMFATFHQKIDLGRISLNAGDGLVIRL